MISAVSPIRRVLEALEANGSRKGSSGDWTCPAHEDSNPSLSVTEGRDGRALVHCHAGCDQEAVVAALGLTMGDLFDEPLANGNGHKPSIIESYPYVDEAGELLFEVVRMTPKTFRQRRPDATSADGWAWKLGNVRRVIYRLPNIIAAISAGRRVFIVEGEKDVHAIERAGEVATCNPGGAKKWRDEYAEHFTGAEVVIVADRDETGREHARQVLAALEPFASAVRIVEPAAGKDAADHLAEGLGLDQFVEADEDSWAPAADVYALASEAIDPPSIMRGQDGALFYRGKRHLVTGEPEALKSWIAAAAAAECLVEGEAVVWWDSDEMGAGPLIERLEAFGAKPEHIRRGLQYLTPDRGMDDAGRATVQRIIERRAPALAVIDALDPALELHGLSPNATDEVQRFYRTVVGLFHRAGVATIIIDHVTKDREARGRWAIGSQRKVGGVDVHFNVEVIGEPLTRERPQARAVIRGGKDRPAWHVRTDGRRIGEFVIDLGSDISWKLELGRAGAVDGRFRPTHLMERVSRFLEFDAMKGASMRAIEEAVKGKREHLRTAVSVLVEEGYATRTEGRNGGSEYHWARKYREDDDERVRPTAPQPRPGEKPHGDGNAPTAPQPRPGGSPETETAPPPGGVTPEGGAPAGRGQVGQGDVEDWRDLL